MKNIIYYISIFTVLLAILYISGFIWLLKGIVFIVFYGSIFYLIYFLYKKIRKQKIKTYRLFVINFIKKISLSFVIIWLLIGMFWIYNIYIFPAVMTQYTISNWKKTVIFQEMSHIWSQNFYNQVRYNLKNYKKEGFVYFFEWVRPWTKENMTKFNQAIWFEFNKDLYKNFSKLYWLTFQDNSLFMGLVNDLDYNIDVDIDWIMEEYSHISASPKTKKVTTQNTIDINSEIIKTLSKLNPRQLEVLRFINKSIFSVLIKSESAQNFIKWNFANKQLFDIILRWRDEVLASAIINSKYNKIYITYWKLHFKWVFNLLQENDKNWKIIDKKEINSIN